MFNWAASWVASRKLEGGGGTKGKALSYWQERRKITFKAMVSWGRVSGWGGRRRKVGNPVESNPLPLSAETQGFIEKNKKIYIFLSPFLLISYLPRFKRAAVPAGPSGGAG